MVIFVAPYIMPVTMTNKETHVMNKFIHDGALTEKGKLELIEMIKKSIEIIEQKKSLESVGESQYFDNFKIRACKDICKTTNAIASKNIYHFSFFGHRNIRVTWFSSINLPFTCSRIYISFDQNDEHIKPSFSIKDFGTLDLKLKAILFYEMGKPNDFESYEYVASLKSNPKIEVSFLVYKDDFNRMDHLPQNFYSIKVFKNDSDTNEYPDAQILYLNKK